MSSSRTYLVRLTGRVEVSVESTGMTTDFDCTVSGNRCTNRGSTRDDSWSGDLAAGNHSVEVFPFQTGPGNYSLTVTATEALTGVGTPLAGGPPAFDCSCARATKTGRSSKTLAWRSLFPVGGRARELRGLGTGATAVMVVVAGADRPTALSPVWRTLPRTSTVAA